MTQRTLRYLRREQRRKVEEENSSRLIASNCVRSTDPGSISYTQHIDEISPVQTRSSERAPQLPTDCYDRYPVRHSPLPREPPSSIVHPRAAPVTRRTLRYLRRAQRREVEDRKVFRLIDSKLARCTNPGPVPHTNQSTENKKISRHNANV